METKHTQGELRVWAHPSKDTGLLLIDKYDTDVATLYYQLTGANATPIKKEETQANAERIALCWNTHDSLVSALKEVVEQFRRVTPLYQKDIDTLERAEQLLNSLNTKP